MSDLQRPAHPDPAYRRNVGIMLLDAAGRAWVGQRIDTPGAWQMPQGGIDAGETPRDAVLRELEEEIGTAKAEILFESAGWFAYDFPPDIQRKAGRGHFRGQAQRWFALRFTGEDADIRIDTHEPEFSAWRWVERAALPRLIVGFKRPVYEAVVEEFEPLLRAYGF